MQHGGLSVDNRYPKFHEILIKNQKVLGPYRVTMNDFLETGSTGTGSWQRLIPMALLISTRIQYQFFPAAYRFLGMLDQHVSRKRKKIIIIKKQNNNRSFRRSRKALIISKFFIHNFFIVHILIRHVEQKMFSYPSSIDWYKAIGP